MPMSALQMRQMSKILHAHMSIHGTETIKDNRHKLFNVRFYVDCREEQAKWVGGECEKRKVNTSQAL